MRLGDPRPSSRSGALAGKVRKVGGSIAPSTLCSASSMEQQARRMKGLGLYFIIGCSASSLECYRLSLFFTSLLQLFHRPLTSQFSDNLDLGCPVNFPVVCCLWSSKGLEDSETHLVLALGDVRAIAQLSEPGEGVPVVYISD